MTKDSERLDEIERHLLDFANLVAKDHDDFAYWSSAMLFMTGLARDGLEMRKRDRSDREFMEVYEAARNGRIR